VKITRNADGEVVYGDEHLCRWLLGYDVGPTFANTLPLDICEALWEFQEGCDIEGFYAYDWDFFFQLEDTDTNTDTELGDEYRVVLQVVRTRDEPGLIMSATEPKDVTGNPP
jgi:hypothetical protein